MAEWTPDSWRRRPVLQDVVYADQQCLEDAIAKLRTLPPLVSPHEVQSLRHSLQDVALGKSFLLQGGDCAESFDACRADTIEAKLKVILQMSLILVWGSRTPVVRIARMAGQYAKPRSKPFEVVDGREIHAFRGDNINGYDIADRTPDPRRLLSAYFHSSATLNYVRSLLSSGFADLHTATEWNLDLFRGTSAYAQYQGLVTSLMDSIRFMQTIGADRDMQLKSVDMFTSHEGLMLEFEEAMTRHVGTGRYIEPKDQGWYNLGAHMLWIGDRTRQLEGGHLEYFRGVQNPIGIKVGPSMGCQELVQVLDRVNPRKEVGKVTLIARYGAEKVEAHLPGHIEAVSASGHRVVWACDPMHGNTRPSLAHPHLKTRHFKDIISELRANIHIHSRLGSRLNGVHFEMTGEDVTECIGGSGGLDDEGLDTAYQTFCDPRLNYEQSLEVAFLIAGYLKDEERAQSA